MQGIDYEILKYRRQYILTDTKISCPFTHSSVKLRDGFALFVHVDLVYCESQNNKQKLILLGDVYDWEHPEFDNKRIIEDLSILSFDALLERISKFAGRFVIIAEDEHGIKILHDASAARKVFYIKSDKFTACSSNQHLLAQIFGIEPSRDESVKEYYSSKEFESNFFSNILDRTFYDEILQLLPNHMLNLLPMEIERYWPRYKIDIKPKEEIISICAEMIKGFLIAASHRYRLMIPITSGYDSRLLLAASKEIRKDVFYYLNDSEHVQDSPDGKIPGKMLSDQDLMFHLISIDKVKDVEFSKVYYQNNLHANREFESIIYNYLIHFSDSLNLPGSTIPIIKSTYYHATSRHITGKRLAKLKGFEKYSFAVKAYSKWLIDLKDVCEFTKTHIYDLLYWEDRNCNGGFQIQFDKDVAQEDLAVFNSAYLISLMLSYDINLRKKPNLELHQEIIKYLWPELLAYPFNPSPKNKMIATLVKLQLYKPIIRLKKVLFG